MLKKIVLLIWWCLPYLSDTSFLLFLKKTVILYNNNDLLCQYDVTSNIIQLMTFNEVDTRIY